MYSFSQFNDGFTVVYVHSSKMDLVALNFLDLKRMVWTQGFLVILRLRIELTWSSLRNILLRFSQRGFVVFDFLFFSPALSLSSRSQGIPEDRFNGVRTSLSQCLLCRLDSQNRGSLENERYSLRA